MFTIDQDQVIIAPSGAAANSNGIYYQRNPHGKTERLAAVLVCNNAKCNEPVVMGADSVFQNIQDWSIPMKQERVYTPRFFHPALEIFSIPASCPLQVAEQTRIAFSHYFNDLKASANAIRTALELLMDAQKVKKTIVDKSGKRKQQTLHARIEDFGRAVPDLRSYLIAAKWIGNAGSHGGELTREELLVGFDLLNHAIYELYEKKSHHKDLLKKAKEINETKRHRLKRKA